jgi:hypothetical protein
MPQSKFLTLAFAGKQKAVFEVILSALRRIPYDVVYVAQHSAFSQNGA